MFFRGILILFIAFLLVLPLAGQAAQVPSSAPTPDDRARQWLTLTDGNDFAQSWQDASAEFRKTRNLQAWTDSAGAMRTPLGALVRRDLESVDLGRANIAVLRYDCAFAHKASAVETVTLIFENGSWKVSGYALR